MSLLCWMCCQEHNPDRRTTRTRNLPGIFGAAFAIHCSWVKALNLRDIVTISTDLVSCHCCRCKLQCRCYICGRVTRCFVNAASVLRSGNTGCCYHVEHCAVPWELVLVMLSRWYLSSRNVHKYLLWYKYWFVFVLIFMLSVVNFWLAAGDMSDKWLLGIFVNMLYSVCFVSVCVCFINTVVMYNTSLLFAVWIYTVRIFYKITT